MKQFIQKLCALPTLSNILLDSAWRDLTKRARHQTNFSDGEFVNKGPFSFFDLVFFSFFYFQFFFFSLCPFWSLLRAQWGSCRSTWPYSWDGVSGFLLYMLLYKVYITHFKTLLRGLLFAIDKIICVWRQCWNKDM